MNNSANILKWYPFRENAKVLEIYDTTSILEKIKKNFELEQQSIQDLQIQGTYDYITLIGTFEYAPTIIENEKAYSTFLRNLKEYLNEDGKILLAIDNRLGIKYLAGAKSKYYSRIYEGVESEIRQKMPNLLLKKEIEKFIKEAGFSNYKFYYPLPDYRNTNSIFTDEFLPKSNHSKILYPLSYEEGSNITFNEIDVIKQICDNDMFTYFTNSYFVEIGKKEIENTIKFVSYNILRKEKYKLILTINKNSVKKVAENDEAISHIRDIGKNLEELNSLGFKTIEKVENETILGKFMKNELDDIIVEKIKHGKTEEAYKEIENWYKYISDKLEKNAEYEENIFKQFNIEVPSEILEKMNFVKQGYIDLSFENIFYDNGYVFYDQEWKFDNIPLEFILYRSINNLYTYNSKKLGNFIEKDELFEKLTIKDYIIYFEELEKKIQTEILDEDVINEYRETISSYFKNNAVEEKVEQTDEIIEDISEKRAEEIEEIVEETNEKVNETESQEETENANFNIGKMVKNLFRKNK